MKFTKEELSLKNGVEKEWIITNGLGGYASSTIVGANTRKYHGLLVAPLTPPARRHVILSKLDECIQIGETEYPFYTNIGKDYISEGYQYQESFEKEYIPVFSYKIKDITIQKQICMIYRKNIVCIKYKIKNGKEKALLKLAPVITFRDFHSVSYEADFSLNQKITGDKKVRIVVNDNPLNPVYMYLSEGSYIPHEKDIFRGMYYLEEEKRGFTAEENLAVAGRYEVELPANMEKEITFICSLEENIEQIEGNKVIEDEKKRLEKLIKETKLIKSKMPGKNQEFLKLLIIATDNFVVYRPAFALHTLIAGYPWFLDWGRDALISFEGLLLKTRRFEMAKQVLLTFIRDMKFGLVPNGYSGYDNRPLYNSVDASLLLFEAVKKYLTYTNNYEFIKEVIYPKLVEVINSYEKGIDIDNNNIYVDTDGLLVSGREFTQNTWMDAKVGDIVATPRNGKAVEINSMWYNSLKIMEELSYKFAKEEMQKKCSKLAKKAKKTFEEKFYYEKKKCLYDVLGDCKIRPNQLFSLSLTYPIIDPSSEIAEEIFNTVTKKLLNRYGLKTLAKGEKDYIEIYEGDSFKRDMSYHQGITWPWLLGIYANSFQAIIRAQKGKTKKQEWKEKYNQFVDSITKTFYHEVTKEGCIGSIAELHDSKTPYLPKGAVAQGWSVAEILRIITETEG